MPFTVDQINNVATAAIDFHFKKGDVLTQSVQDKPFLKYLSGAQKEFPGGAGNITRRVKGIYTTTVQGFQADDNVTYANPTNLKTATYPWKLHHAGITFTMDELLKNGISVTDTETGSDTVEASGAERVQLANVMQDKLEDLSEGWKRGMNLIFWKDGTQDSKVLPGLLSFILDVPTSATVVGGIDQSLNPWWQNRASLSINNGHPAADQQVVQVLQREIRQLRRFGGRPNKWFAGSLFMDWFEQELRAKGNYTLEGWSKSGSIDASVADLSFKGINCEYDPTLDDLGRSKFCYFLDSKTIYPMVMTGEDMKKHAPARPETKYAFYRALTWVGGLVCDQRNANGVYSVI